MHMNNNGLTQEYLKSILDYDGKNLIWRVSRKRGRVGRLAGTISNGYRMIKIDYRSYYEHRLVWLYLEGELPIGHIDHINHDRSDNSIRNLREVAPSDNSRNKKIGVSNKSGFNGISWYKRDASWLVTIGYKGKPTRVGSYKDIEEAISARLFANSYYGYHENHGL
jgi:hypothetical protein